MTKQTITAIIIEDDQCMRLEELCQATKAEPDFIIELIEHELISPLGKTEHDWRFNSECLRRSKKAVSFRRDLNINIEGIALALDLLDQMQNMEAELRVLKRLVDED